MLKVNFFREFKIEYKDKTIGDSLSKSKKHLSLLGYLMLMSDKTFSKEALMDLLWDDDRSDNPGNALKTAIHRIRATLDQLDYPEEIIIRDGSSYRLNRDIPILSDVVEFEKLCKIVMDSNEENAERLKCYREASALYTGDFLEQHKADPWVIPIRTYYRSMFLSSTYEAIHILEVTQDYTEAEKFAEKAVLVDPYDENLHYCLVKSRIKQGKRIAALEHYNYTVDLFHDKYDVTPSKEFIALYRDITEQTHLETHDMDMILENLREAPNKEAFFCNYEMFKDMYQFKARVLATKPEESYIFLLTLRSDESGVVSDAAGKLKRYLKANLNRSSVITRYSKSQFLMMILNEPKEISEKKIQKLLTKFKKENPIFNVDFELLARHIEATADVQ